MAKRYVIQEHARGGQIHWDLMLESGSILKTWRLDAPPENIGSQTLTAIKIFDHDLKFLTYEGLVNSGLGSVRIVETGSFNILAEDEASIRLSFQSKILKGNFVLEHASLDKWLFYLCA